jgi:hypothetical protein
MALVNLGLGFHYARLVVQLLVIVVSIFGQIAVSMTLAAAPATALGLAIVVGFALITLNLAMGLLGLIGSALCMWVPPRGGRVLIVISGALDAPQLPLAVLSFFVPMAGLGFHGLMLLCVLMELAAWILFMLFLRRLCLLLGEEMMAREATRLLIKGIVLMVAPIPFAILLYLVAGAVPFLMCVLALAVFAGVIYWIVLIIKFIFEELELIGSMRQVIVSRG